MSFYSDLQTTATRLLTSKGLACTLRKNTAGAYNPAAGSASVTSADYSTVGVLLNYSKSLINVADSMIQVNDRKAIIKGTVTPDLDDLLIFNSITYRIISIKTVNPADIVLIHELQVRV